MRVIRAILALPVKAVATQGDSRMYAEKLNAQLLAALDRPDLRVVAKAQRVCFDASLDTAFRADPGGEVVLGAACLGTARVCAFTIRHALELSMLLDIATRLPASTQTGSAASGELIACDLPILAGLCAARTASLFWQLDGAAGDGPADAQPASWLEAMAGETPPPAAILNLVWARVRGLQGSSYRLLRAACLGADDSEVPAAVLRRLRQIWNLLGPAEALMARGGDQRLAVDPRTGLNHYGCSHRPRPWAITFASSTASSLSERGFGGAEASRRRIAASALAGRHGTALALEAASVRREIAAHYALTAGCEVVLAASGTDCELLVLALAERDGPVCSILTAPEETGTGVPLAAAGRHFATDTSGRQQVSKGEVIEGFRGDTTVLPLAVRHADGSLRAAAEIEAECVALATASRQHGRRVLVHLLDLSKTGLLAPSLACLERLQASEGQAIDIVVDACQARLDQRRVRDYLARGWMVMITGSKFFTGPPFCGAVLLPERITARLAHGTSHAGGPLPAGLAAYGCRADWPDSLAASSHLPDGINLGMVLRWQAALAEMQAFGAVPATRLRTGLGVFLAGVRAAIGSHPDLILIEVPAPARALLPGSGSAAEPSWDQVQTILSFLVLEPASRTGKRPPLTLGRARQLYRWLNADVSHALPDHATGEECDLGRLLCHIGQPAPVSHAELPGVAAGALRISAGARLLSGEPSHEGLDFGRRLERETADARRVLDKITLLLRYWDAVQAADPEPSYAPRDRGGA